MNNLAELTSVTLDNTSVLQQRWQEQLEFASEVSLNWRNYLQLDLFTDYYRSLLLDITDKIGLPYKNFVVQYYNHRSSDKWGMCVIHQDAYRQTCVTVSLTDLIEPVCFYLKDTEIGRRYRRSSVRGSQKIPQPVQISNYSRLHPTLVNVSNFHNVRVLEDQIPRILLQVSYDFSFEEIIDRAPDQWRIV